MATYINTRDVLGEQATLDGLVAHSLTEFTDSDITQLGQYAFYKQSQMKEIKLPNLESIGAYAFVECTGLKKIHIGMEKDTPCTLSSANAFDNPGRSIIYVNPDLVSEYRTYTNWSAYANRIYGYGDDTAPEWDETEIIDTPSEIATKVANGTAANYYKLGQYKSIDLGSEGIHNFQIIGINKDELYNGTGYAQLTWCSMDVLPTNQKMNSALEGTSNPAADGIGCYGGWDKCEMKRYLLTNIWDKIPEIWQNMIKNVKKYSYSYSFNDKQLYTDYMTNETLFLFSNRELFGTSSTKETLGPIYDFAFLDNNTRIRKKDLTSYKWWQRSSANSNGGNSWCFVHVGGSGSNGSANMTDVGVVFGFCT